MRRMLMVLAVATVVAALMAPGPVAADLPTMRISASVKPA